MLNAPEYLTDEELMSRSVMQPEKSYIRRAFDFLVGGSPSERATFGMTSPLNTKIAKVPTDLAPEVANSAIFRAIPQAIRGLGREGMQFFRRAGKRIQVEPLFDPEGFLRGQYGRDTGTGIARARLNPVAPKRTAYHEVSGHAGEQELPLYAREPLEQAMVTAGELEAGREGTGKVLGRSYGQKLIGEELAAWSREPEKIGGRSTELLPETRDLFNLAYRESRKRLKELERGVKAGKNPSPYITPRPAPFPEVSDIGWRDWKEFFADVPEEALHRYQQIMATAGHSTDPVRKKTVQDAADKYIQNAQKLARQGKALKLNPENETLKKKLLRGDVD